MRGHATIQGSSDIPTLYDLLPGYLHMPRAPRGGAHARRLHRSPAAPTRGWWSHFDQYIVSLLKAWFGDAATAENDYGFGHLPKITGNHAHFPTMMRAVDGGLDGLFVMGQNPAIGSQNGGLMRRALRNMKWLVVRDFARDRDRDVLARRARGRAPARCARRTSRPRSSSCPPPRTSRRRGRFTQTQRMVQWRDKALDPPGDARSELWFMHHLTKRVKAHYAGSTARARLADRQPPLALPGARAAARARGRRTCCARSTATTWPPARRCRGFAQLQADGSTACGCWIYSGVMADGVNQARRRDPGDIERRGRLGLARVGLGLAGQPAHPLQPRVGRPARAGPGASARSTSGGTRSRAGGRATTSPTSRSTSRPTTGRPTTAARAWTRSPATSRS